MKKRRLSVFDKAELAMKQAVDGVVENHIEPVRSFKVSRESIEEMRTGEQEHFFKADKEYIISKYSSNRYFVAIVSKTGNIVPVFPFTSRRDAQDYINNCGKRG
jgi:hypothetical protein